jgi:hypothetical protein
MRRNLREPHLLLVTPPDFVLKYDVVARLWTQDRRSQKMAFRRIATLLATTLPLALSATEARAHWCNDLWASSYNLTVRPDSDTSPKEVYVQNNMGYQLTSFKLTATASSGAITLTAPTTLKVSGTLLPGEKGTWKIASGNPAKIEDITFSVSFGSSGQSGMYPTSGAKAVMIVKTDGSLSPASPPAGLANSAGSAGNGQARSIEYQALADWDTAPDGGLDKLMTLYCAGRGSWGSSDGVTMANCKDNASTSCPTTKPSGVGSKFDYVHLWAAGALAIRKSALGSRLATLRERLKCGTNDGDTGFAGFAMFVLGYLGDDATAKTWVQTQASGTGDIATIAKAALYMMGDTTQKSAVQSGATSSSVFVKVACAGALGIVDKDDASVTSSIIPEVKWNEPDVASEDGKGMYAAHVLEIVAYHRRGWVAKGVGTGAVSFYGETGVPVGTGGSTGPGGSTGSGGAIGSGGTSGAGSGGSTGRDGGSTGRGGTTGTATGTGGSTTVVGAGGSTRVGGAPGAGGAVGSGGRGGSTTPPPGTGGNIGPGGSTQPPSGVGGTTPSGAGGDLVGTGGVEGGGSGGSTDDPEGSGGSTGGGGGTEVKQNQGSGCSLGGRTDTASLAFLALAALAFLRLRRRQG